MYEFHVSSFFIVFKFVFFLCLNFFKIKQNYKRKSKIYFILINLLLDCLLFDKEKDLLSLNSYRFFNFLFKLFSLLTLLKLYFNSFLIAIILQSRTLYIYSFSDHFKASYPKFFYPLRSLS